MKIERVDERTVKCFLSNEELEEYNISYKDFILRSDKAREMVEDIIEQAAEEVGYQPPRFAFDLQIMMLPDQGMILTFSDRGPDSDSPEKELMDCLKNMKDYVTNGGKPMFLGGDHKFGDFISNLMKLSGISKLLESEKEQKEEQDAEGDPKTDKPGFAVFCFHSLRTVCEFAKALPDKLLVKSALYCMDEQYYLFLERGDSDYERYSRACIQALEFSTLYAAEQEQTAYLKEHGECVIAEDALFKLRL